MEITKLINDVLSTFTSYIVDCAADPGYMPQIKKSLEDTCKGTADVDEIVSHMEHLVGEIVAMSAQTKDYLNVYISDPTEGWSGGVALIAAENANKANDLLEELREEGCRGFDYPRLISNLRYIGESEVIFDATYRE